MWHRLNALADVYVEHQEDAPKVIIDLDDITITAAEVWYHVVEEIVVFESRLLFESGDGSHHRGGSSKGLRILSVLFYGVREADTGVIQWQLEAVHAYTWGLK